MLTRPPPSSLEEPVLPIPPPLPDPAPAPPPMDGTVGPDGFARSPAVTAPGLTVQTDGHGRWRTRRVPVSELPAVRDAVREVQRVIRSEQPCDLLVKAGALQMTPSGTLRVAAQELPLERLALRDLAELLHFGPGAWFLTQTDDPELRARNVNLFLELHRDQWLMVRTREAGGQRMVQAVSGPRTSHIRASRLLDYLLPALEGTRAELTHADQLVLTVFWKKPIRRLGETFHLGARLAAHSSRSPRVEISPVLHRCRGREAWVGAPVELRLGGLVSGAALEKLGKDLGLLLARAQEAAEALLDRWVLARERRLDVPAQLGRWARSRRLRRQLGLEDERQAEKLALDLRAAWEADPGDTLAHAVQALARAAWQGRWSNERRDLMERAAGAFLLPSS